MNKIKYGMGYRPRNNRNNEGLSDQMKEFCHRYCTHFDRALAYQEVYDCAAKDARSSANALMRRDGVSQYIDEILAARKNETIRINVDEIINELQILSLTRLDDIIDLETGEIRPDVDRTALAAISEYVCDETENEYGIKRKYKLKLYSKVQASEILLKVSGFSSDINQALRTLDAFGVKLRQDDKGEWFIEK